MSVHWFCDIISVCLLRDRICRMVSPLENVGEIRGLSQLYFGSRNGCRQRALAFVAVLVGQECPYLAIAQTCHVKAHMRSDIGGIEIETTAQLIVAPISITAYIIAT